MTDAPSHLSSGTDEAKLADEMQSLGYIEFGDCLSIKAFNLILAALRSAGVAQKSGEPIAWMVERKSDPTFPRLYEDEVDAVAMVTYVTVNPPATMKPLYDHPAQTPPDRDEIAKRIAFSHLGDDREWKGFLSHADRFLAYAVPSTDRCAECGHPRAEHSYNGACYGLCGKFVSSVTSTPRGSEP